METNRMHQIKPTIKKRNGKHKMGRGFSPDELAKAGVNKLQAKQMGLSVDFRRRTAHDANVATIKVHAEKAKLEAKPKAAPKPETKVKKKAKS